MNKGINLKKIKDTEIAKRLIAPLPPWWKKVRDYSFMVFLVSSALMGAAPLIGISATGITIISIIMSLSGTLSGAAQMTKQ